MMNILKRAEIFYKMSMDMGKVEEVRRGCLSLLDSMKRVGGKVDGLIEKFSDVGMNLEKMKVLFFGEMKRECEKFGSAYKGDWDRLSQIMGEGGEYDGSGSVDAVKPVIAPVGVVKTDVKSVGKSVNPISRLVSNVRMSGSEKGSGVINSEMISDVKVLMGQMSGLNFKKDDVSVGKRDMIEEALDMFSGVTGYDKFSGGVEVSRLKNEVMEFLNKSRMDRWGGSGEVGSGVMGRERADEGLESKEYEGVKLR